MSRSDVDQWLDECDDVLDGWAGSVDSADWAADGSHEREDVPLGIDPSEWAAAAQRVAEGACRAAKVMVAVSIVIRPALRRFGMKMTHSQATLRAAAIGAPLPVPPRPISRMTARQYRAARRRYARESRAWSKA